MTFAGKIRYDRRVGGGFLGHSIAGGVAESLAQYAKRAPYPVDLQMRHSPKTGADHATLYVGLTAVLNVRCKGSDQLSLDAHRTWSEGPYGFESDWLGSYSEAEWRRQWYDVEEYLEKVIPAAAKTHATKEGAVQAAVSSFDSTSRVMLDREVTPHFKDTDTKVRTLGSCKGPLLEARQRTKPAPGKVPTSLGAECDLLALNGEGRLLAVEVKPGTGSSVAWSPAQAIMYARVLGSWIADDGADNRGWHRVIDGMLDQRKKLGLVSPSNVQAATQDRVVPVVAVQRGVSAKAKQYMFDVQQALLDEGIGDPDLLMYQVSLSGRLDPLT